MKHRALRYRLGLFRLFRREGRGTEVTGRGERGKEGAWFTVVAWCCRQTIAHGQAAHVQTHTRKCTNTHSLAPNTQACVQTYAHFTNTNTRKCTNTGTHTHMYTLARMYKHTKMYHHAHTHMYKHMHIHTHTPVQTHAHTQAVASGCHTSQSTPHPMMHECPTP